MPRVSSDPFAVDIEAFRQEQAERAPGALIREALQNGLDSASSQVSVLVKPAKDGGYDVVVNDDGAGFADLRAAWTFFVSGKRDDPTKRGRMGRGLKELLSVADEAEIVTTSGMVTFTRVAKGKWERSEHPRTKRDQGTSLHVRVKSIRWRKEQVEEAIAYLNAVVPPDGIAVLVNQKQLAPVHGGEWLDDIQLQTVLYDTGDERKAQRKTSLHIFDRPDGEAWLYELGLPVQRIDYPHSIDVQQRIPLKAHRDAADPDWLRTLYAKLLNLTADKLDKDQLTSTWATEAAQDKDALTTEAKRALMRAYVPEGVYVARTHDEHHEATGHHVPSMMPSAIPSAVRRVVWEVAPKAREKLDSFRTIDSHEATDQTPNQKRLVRVWTELCKLAGMPTRIELWTGKPSNAADFNAGTIRVFRAVVGPAFFEDPLAPRSLSLLIHELSHWDHESEHAHSHGIEFHSDAEKVGARIASTIWKHHDKLAALLAED